AYCALSLQGRGVTHIHVHHGYFASWVAMAAARLLGINFSMTLHGSDLLLHAAYLDTKLKHCNFCITISEFNRQYILDHYPDVDPAKIAVFRMGVEAVSRAIPTSRVAPERFVMLAGVPLAAVEAKAHGKVVFAPPITGLPALVLDGQTGFPYRPGSLDDFVVKVDVVRHPVATRLPPRCGARQHVAEHVHRTKTVAAF